VTLCELSLCVIRIEVGWAWFLRLGLDSGFIHWAEAFAGLKIALKKSRLSWEWAWDLLNKWISQAWARARLSSGLGKINKWPKVYFNSPSCTWFSMSVFSLATWPLEMVEARVRNSVDAVDGNGARSFLSTSTSFGSKISSRGICGQCYNNFDLRFWPILTDFLAKKIKQ
jgi:hypothetical protein